MCNPGDDYIPFLKQAGCDRSVINHCLAVRNAALGISNRISDAGTPVNKDLVAKGAILHDIGRSVTHGLDHADVGGKICRELGLEEEIALIVERHIGAGLTSNERILAGLSPVDRIPGTVEEKIVAHADNMVKGSYIMDMNEFMDSISKYPEDIRKRFLDLSNELNTLENKSLQ